MAVSFSYFKRENFGSIQLGPCKTLLPPRKDPVSTAFPILNLNPLPPSDAVRKQKNLI